MKRKGFTLVELIAVIVIIGVLALILIPVISNSSKNAKQKMLETKVETSSQALVVWAQNNRKCFFSDATAYGNTCLIGLNKNCTKNSTKENIVNCEVSYGELASFGIIKYDDESNNEVINPTNNNSMNNEKVFLEYDLNTKIFCIGQNCTKEVTTTKKVINMPQIIVNPESDEEWSESKTIEVIVSGGTAGLAEGGTIEYGFSESQAEAPEYTSYPLIYADGDNNTTFNVVGSNLSGKYYLWLKPNITSKNGIRLQNKVTGPYYFDNPNLTVNLLATKNGLNTKVESDTWSDTGLNFKFSLEEVNIDYTIYYCKDTENTCNPNTSVTNNTQITDYNGVTGEYYIRYKVVTKVGNSSEISSYHAKVDTSKPTVKVTGYKYNASGTNKVGDKVVNQITYTGDATFKISDSWVNYGATFEFVSTSTSGIKSIVWKWNSEGSSTDTGSTYPSANASNQTSPFTTKYASLTGAGYRKGQWVVTNNAGKTTTITVVIKIDTCSADTTTSYSAWSWGACSKTCGTGTQTGTRTKTVKSKFGQFTCSTTTETDTQNCSSNSGCASTYICNRPSSEGMYKDPYNNCRFANDKSMNSWSDIGQKNSVSFNNEIWRIIGVFDIKKNANSAAEKRIKLIRGSVFTKEHDYMDSFNGIWDDFFMKRYLNDYLGSGLTDDDNGKKYSLNAESQNLIDDASWYIGSPDNRNSNYTASQFYDYEHNMVWYGKVGLMSVSDYGFASMSCKNGSKTVYQYNNCPNWLQKFGREFTMIRSGRYNQGCNGSYNCTHIVSNIFIIDCNSNYSSDRGKIAEGDVFYKNYYRPVVYLKSDVIITGGDGSYTNPYTLSL